MNLEDALKHEDAKSLKTYIQNEIENNDKCVLDLQDVKRASLSCIQLLLSVQKEHTFDELKIILSQELIDIFLDLGIDDFPVNKSEAGR